jgi:membrane protein YdbS with pleckstrin-like domain
MGDLPIDRFAHFADLPAAKPMFKQQPMESPQINNRELNKHASDAAELSKFDPNHIKAMRLSAAFLALPLLIAGFVAEMVGIWPPGLAIVPAVVIAGLILFRIPSRRYHARGYSMADERLRIVSGIWFKSDTVVPFGRVQHIDVEQGPIARMYGLATLTVHTAGSHNASVHLAGLAHDDALNMRETVRLAIKRDTL